MTLIMSLVSTLTTFMPPMTVVSAGSSISMTAMATSVNKNLIDFQPLPLVSLQVAGFTNLMGVLQQSPLPPMGFQD